jgi:hypothetical protein
LLFVSDFYVILAGRNEMFRQRRHKKRLGRWTELLSFGQWLGNVKKKKNTHTGWKEFEGRELELWGDTERIYSDISHECVTVVDAGHFPLPGVHLI